MLFRSRPVLEFCGSLTQVMFKFAGVIMKFAPLGVGAAIAVTVGHQGLGSLITLGKLVLTLYAALVVFVVCVLGVVIWIAKVPLKPFVRAVREPFTLAFATANSEAALPKAFELMEKLGVPRGIVGFVLPAGYSFNLDGSTLHLAVASVFVAQAAETRATRSRSRVSRRRMDISRTTWWAGISVAGMIAESSRRGPRRCRKSCHKT